MSDKAVEALKAAIGTLKVVLSDEGTSTLARTWAADALSRCQGALAEVRATPRVSADIVEDIMAIYLSHEAYFNAHRGGPAKRSGNFRARLKEYAAKVSPWIPVGDRLPDDGVRVLVIEPVTNEDELHDIAYRADGVWHLAQGLCPESVTHWMPLPEPPVTTELP